MYKVYLNRCRNNTVRRRIEGGSFPNFDEAYVAACQLTLGNTPQGDPQKFSSNLFIELNGEVVYAEGIWANMSKVMRGQELVDDYTLRLMKGLNNEIPKTSTQSTARTLTEQ